MGGLVRAVALTGSDQVVLAAPGAYRGLTVRETAGSTAAVRVYDHASAGSGTLLETVSLAANASVQLLYPAAVWAVNGIYVDIVSGTVEGSVRVG